MTTELTNLIFRAIAKIEDPSCLNDEETAALVEDLEGATINDNGAEAIPQ